MTDDVEPVVPPGEDIVTMRATTLELIVQAERMAQQLIDQAERLRERLHEYEALRDALRLHEPAPTDGSPDASA